METLLNWGELIERASSAALLRAFIIFELLALISIPSVLLKRRGRPLPALAWLFSLVALPVFGVVAWWAFGRTRIERRLRPHVQRKRAYVEQHGSPSHDPKTRFTGLLPARAQGEYAFSTSGNHVELLTDGVEAFPALERALFDAKESIHFLIYIFRLDETGQRLCGLLADKARQGVAVRVLVDGFGSQSTVQKLRKLLTPHGVQFGVFLPLRLRPLHAPRFNFINHRKIVVVDNRVAFSGGMNVGAEYEHSWRDLMLRLEGPSVAGLNHIFLEDWFFATRQAIHDPVRFSLEPRSGGCDVAIVSSGPDTEPWIHDAYFMAFTRAETTLWIVTPYFIPTSPILTALRTAAGRGVDVRLIVPHLSDVTIVSWASRSYYPLLVEAGVRIFEYRGRMLHAKALVMDGICSIGTANIDHRSMRLNFEVCSFINSPVMARSLLVWMEELMAGSLEMDRARLQKVGKLQSLLESAAHLMSPLL